MRALCLHGPNLNLLGLREPHRYGARSLAQIDADLIALGHDLGVHVTCLQSNHEGQLIDWIQAARGAYDALLFNPGGYTHTSVALRDAVLAADIPCVEVHLTNVYAREPFRHTSLFADIALARVMGFGAEGYALALRGAVAALRPKRGEPPGAGHQP
jgi:3-dehydroquinate dehydratase-2